MKKTTIILLVLAMVLVVFTVGCGEKDSASSDSQASRLLGDGNDDIEAARGSDSYIGINVDDINLEGVTLDDINMFDDSDGATFKRAEINMDNLVSTEDRR